IQRLRDHNDGYTITITEVMQPAKGILIAFSFDNKKIALSYELFDSINLQKGIVFRLYNKELLQQLEQKNNQPVLRTLWHKPDFTTLSPRLQSTGNASYDTTKDKSLGRPCIAIDSGHGGSDCGAIGIGGIQEKDISLAIGIKVGNLLEQHGFSVVMTRNSDDTVGLDERTSYANNNHADLFVSIHANWASNQRAIGIETFCLKPTLLKKGFSLLSDAQQNLYANVLQQRFDDAHTLAQAVQHRLCDAVSHHHNDFIDRKVKYSVSQVLLGTQAPSILVEVGFVSHPKEAVLLHDTEYQSNVARGICDGILSVVSYNNFL
ncbi:MAG TPA: N-acetylmuramoyl-L-alanine amidase, partial [Candidatus Babeliales bacterium]|nr:N-acetylmuramoyl-L-alanine amidase [Candidatus Babeliales bacterium]